MRALSNGWTPPPGRTTFGYQTLSRSSLVRLAATAAQTSDRFLVAPPKISDRNRNTASNKVFQTVNAISASEPRRSRHASRSPYISVLKTFDLPRGPDRVGVVCLAIIVVGNGRAPDRSPLVSPAAAGLMCRSIGADEWAGLAARRSCAASARTEALRHF
jgi:hypothetical protein